MFVFGVLLFATACTDPNSDNSMRLLLKVAVDTKGMWLLLKVAVDMKGMWLLLKVAVDMKGMWLLKVAVDMMGMWLVVKSGSGHEGHRVVKCSSGHEARQRSSPRIERFSPIPFSGRPSTLSVPARAIGEHAVERALFVLTI